MCTAESIAARLLAVRRGAPPLADYAGGPADEAQALAVQHLVAAETGPVCGFKTGRRDAGSMPLMAPLRARIASGGTADPATTRLCGVELEIGFLLVADPPAADAPDFEARLRAAVQAVPALEIVESRLQEPEAAGPLWKLADDQINGAVVLGAPVADWRGVDLVAPAVRLSVGGAVVQAGPAPVPGGDAFATFAAFARRVGGHCGGLRAGHVAITGSLTGLRFAARGDAVEGVIEGLGPVAVRFP